jgi:hypothetical protein
MSQKDMAVIIKLISFLKENFIYLGKEILTIKIPNCEVAIFCLICKIPIL